LCSNAVAGLPGGFNDDGTVGAADYVVWRNQLGSGVSLRNDNTPGVGQDDYDRWATNFGQSLGNGASNADAVKVPEPVPLVLILTAALTALAHCRRNRSSSP
jgi:hypothetical protein